MQVERDRGGGKWPWPAWNTVWEFAWED